MTFKEYLEMIQKKHDQVSAIWDKVDAEGKGEATPAQIAEIKALNKEIEELEKKAADLKEGEELRAQNEKRREDAKKQRLQFEKEEKDKDSRNPSDAFTKAKLASLGLQFVNDEEFKTWQAQVAKGGNVANGMNLQSPRVEVKGLITGLSDTSAGAAIQTDYKPLVNAAPFRPLTIRQLITNGQAMSDLIEFAQFTGGTNNAAVVAEATTTANGTKPESAMTMAKVTAAVKTIAHWIPATNRSLADLAVLRTLIDAFLSAGLEEKLEDQIVAGDGTGENFTGILNTAGILTQAFVTDVLVSTRKGRTKVRKTGRVIPTAYAMSPEDWEVFDLMKDGEDRYMYGGPSILGNARLWGLPVVESEAIPTGRTILGAWQYAVLWDRDQATISASNSHANYFIQNLVAILAELRAAFGVLYPKAFCDIDLAA